MSLLNVSRSGLGYRYAAFVAAIALVTACGSQTTSSGSKTDAASEDSGRTGTAVDVCNALSADQMRGISGLEISATQPNLPDVSTPDGNSITRCTYNDFENGDISVEVNTKDANDLFESSQQVSKAFGVTPESVSGVGDRAWSLPKPTEDQLNSGLGSGPWFGAVVGPYYVEISGLTYVSADQGKQIVEALQPALT